MNQNEHTPEQDATETQGQARPETGIDQDPSQNTSPPSNPETDHEAVEKGKENLNSVVNW